jgi:hypothetical protein
MMHAPPRKCKHPECSLIPHDEKVYCEGHGKKFASKKASTKASKKASKKAASKKPPAKVVIKRAKVASETEDEEDEVDEDEGDTDSDLDEETEDERPQRKRTRQDTNTMEYAASHPPSSLSGRQSVGIRAVGSATGGARSEENREYASPSSFSRGALRPLEGLWRLLGSGFWLGADCDGCTGASYWIAIA